MTPNSSFDAKWCAELLLSITTGALGSHRPIDATSLAFTAVVLCRALRVEFTDYFNTAHATIDITGSTVVLTYCKGDCQSQWETPIFGPSQPGKPSTDFDKFETDDYIGHATRYAKFGFCTFSSGVSPYR